MAFLFGGRKKEAKVLLIGLDYSGKTTILNVIKSNNSAAKHDDFIETQPTIGFNVEKFSMKHINFTVYDMSGQGKFRNLWQQYYRDISAIIWVIDLTDRLRLCVVKHEMIEALSDPDLRARRIPLLFFANKMDDRTGMSISEVNSKLQITDLFCDKPWQIYATCGLSGQGLKHGLEWLNAQLKLQAEKKG